jgi:hypothetical protein
MVHLIVGLHRLRQLDLGGADGVVLGKHINWISRFLFLLLLTAVLAILRELEILDLVVGLGDLLVTAVTVWGKLEVLDLVVIVGDLLLRAVTIMEKLGVPVPVVGVEDLVVSVVSVLEKLEVVLDLVVRMVDLVVTVMVKREVVDLVAGLSHLLQRGDVHPRLVILSQGVLIQQSSRVDG